MPSRLTRRRSTTGESSLSLHRYVHICTLVLINNPLIMFGSCRHVSPVPSSALMPASSAASSSCPISNGMSFPYISCFFLLDTNVYCREFGLNEKSSSAADDLSGNLVTTMQAGAILGSMICSQVADRWGRKAALIAVAITGFIGGILQAFSFGNYACFYIGR